MTAQMVWWPPVAASIETPRHAPRSFSWPLLFLQGLAWSLARMRLSSSPVCGSAVLLLNGPCGFVSWLNALPTSFCPSSW
jgi:hypothetical protein